MIKRDSETWPRAFSAAKATLPARAMAAEGWYPGHVSAAGRRSIGNVPGRLFLGDEPAVAPDS